VYRAKGYTNNAIALAVALVVESIVHDSRRTMPLSIRLDGYLGERDVCLSVPVVVGHGGVVRELQPELSEQELSAFHSSARTVRAAIAALQSGTGQ
jgi:L-lactate dehydrogenase